MKKIFIITIISSLLLTGCSQQEEEPPVSTQPVIPVETEEPEPIDGYRITKSDTSLGVFRVNYIQRVNVWDDCNSTAVNLGIDHSYAVNLEIDWDYDYSTVGANIYLVDANDIVHGHPGFVGWSGFPTTLSLNKGEQGIIETIVQPEILDETGLQLAIEITVDGKECNRVLLVEDFTQVESVGAVLDNKTAEIITIGNNRIHLGIKTVYEDTLYDSSRKRDSGAKGNYYSYKYTLGFDSSEDLSIDPMFDNQTKTLNSHIVSWVKQEGISNLCYSGNSELYLAPFSDDTNAYHYISKEYPGIAKGKEHTISVNRQKLKDVGTKYVRIGLEFPEEIQVMSLEQIKNFNGRYLVFRKKVSERKLLVYDPSKYRDIVFWNK